MRSVQRRRGAFSRASCATTPAVYRTDVGTLKDAGFELLPTFIAPHHTVLMSNLEAADDLAPAFGNLVVNPYVEGREEER